MQVGMIGLGRMGANMARRLLRGGHQVLAYDVNDEAVRAVAAEGAVGVSNLSQLVERLSVPRVVWCMLPAGAITEQTIQALAPLLAAGDIVVDGGNANYKDTLRRGQSLRERGLQLVDAGTSGGIWGLAEGYSLMVGGDEEAVRRIQPLLETLAPAANAGWGRVGPTGAGHFVKMVHNGVEYGLMQSYAEGFDILHAKTDFDLDLHQIANIWRFGSVVKSWLLDRTAEALAEDQDLRGIKGWVEDSGEGRWMAFEAVDLDVPAPVITLSLIARLASRREDSYAAKLLAALRQRFGGHEVRRTDSS